MENLLTDVIFINHGRVALSASVEDLGSRYQQLTLAAEQAARARALQPFYEREVFGRVAMFFEGRSAAELGTFGELRTPSIADLFVAKMQGGVVHDVRTDGDRANAALRRRPAGQARDVGKARPPTVAAARGARALRSWIRPTA